MKQLTDEILNKYIDDELLTNELNQLKELIAKDDEALSLLKAHKLADQILYKMEATPAPVNFTEKVMNNILDAVPKAVKKSYFVPAVIGFFVAAIIGVVGYALSLPAPEPDPQSKTVFLMNEAKEILTQKVGAFSSFFNNETILIVGSFLTFILLLSAYFMINSHKNFKHNLDKFSH